MAGRKKQESAAEAAPKQQTLEEAFAELDTVNWKKEISALKPPLHSTRGGCSLSNSATIPLTGWRNS